MDDCVFCKIVAGDLPSTEVASSEGSYAFRDLEPAAPTHVLVVPRRHVTDADHLELSDGDLLADLFVTARKAADAEGLSPANGGNGYRLLFNVGDDASNSVPHLHLHVIGGRKLSWPPG